MEDPSNRFKGEPAGKEGVAIELKDLTTSKEVEKDVTSGLEGNKDDIMVEVVVLFPKVRMSFVLHRT